MPLPITSTSISWKNISRRGSRSGDAFFGVVCSFYFALDLSCRTASFFARLIPVIVLVLSGALGVACLILYFKALQDNEASVVVPYYQTIPIFGFILGYFILGEVLNASQIVACGLVIIGTIILSLDLTSF